MIDSKIIYTGGINLGDDYLGKSSKTGAFKDSAIRICGGENHTFEAAYRAMWDSAGKRGKRQTKWHGFSAEVGEGSSYFAFTGGPCRTFSDLDLTNYLCQKVEKCKDYAWFSTPYLIPARPFLDTLKSAVMRGVDVRIVIPGVPDKAFVFRATRAYAAKLAAMGVKIYLYNPGFLHEKCMIFDGTAAVLGSVNLDCRSFYHNYENGVLIRDPGCIRDVLTDYLMILSESRPFSSKSVKTIVCKRTFSSLFDPLL